MSNPYSDLMQHISTENAKLRALHAAFAHRQLNQFRQIFHLIAVLTVAVLAIVVLLIVIETTSLPAAVVVPTVLPIDHAAKGTNPVVHPAPEAPLPIHPSQPGDLEASSIHYVI